MDWPAVTPPVPKHDQGDPSRRGPDGLQDDFGIASQPISGGGLVAVATTRVGPPMGMAGMPPSPPSLPSAQAPSHVHSTVPHTYSTVPRSDGIGGGYDFNAGHVPGSSPHGRYSRHLPSHLHSPHWSPAAAPSSSSASQRPAASGAGDQFYDNISASGGPAGYGHHTGKGSSTLFQRPMMVDYYHQGQLGGTNAHQPYPYQSPASSRRRIAQDARQLAAPYVPYNRESYAPMSIGRRQGSASAAMSSSSRASAGEDAGAVARLSRQVQSPSLGHGGNKNYSVTSRTRLYSSSNPMPDSGVFAVAAGEHDREPECFGSYKERDPYAVAARHVLLRPPQAHAQEQDWRTHDTTSDSVGDTGAATTSFRNQPGQGQCTSTLPRLDDYQPDSSYYGRDSSRFHPFATYPGHDPLATPGYMDAPHQPPQPVRPAEHGHHHHHAYPFHYSRHWHDHYDPYTGMPPPPPLPRQSSRVESIEMPNPMSPASASVSTTDLTHGTRSHNDQYPPVYQAQSTTGANPSPRGSTILAAGPHASYNYYPHLYPPHRHPSDDRHLHGQPLPSNPYHAPPPPPPPFPTHPHYSSEYDPHAYAWHARPDAPYYLGRPPMYPPEAYYHYMREGAGHPAPAPPPRAHDPSVYAHGPYPDPDTVYPRYPLPPDSFAYAQADTNRPDGAAAGEARQSSGGRRGSRAAAALASGRATMGRARTDRGAAGHMAGSEEDEQDEIESEADEEAEEEEEDELEEEAGASDRGECADQACGGNEPGGAAEQKRRNYFVFSKVAYELMVRAIRVDRGLDELPAGMQATQGTQHALEVAHWVCGLRRKKWTRLKARLDMDESQPFFRSLTWKKCTMQIIPREDWPDLIRQAHELTDEIGNVTHLSLKQTFRRLRTLCQTRRSRCGISKEACAEYLPRCSCSERKRQRAAVLESMEARCANK